MSLPAFVLLPPAKLKKQIDPSEWNRLLSSWNTLVHAYVGLSAKDFSRLALRPEAKVEPFLESFLDHALASRSSFSENDLERLLRQACFLLIARISSSDGKQSRLHGLPFIQNLCVIYMDLPDLPAVARRLWQLAKKTSSFTLADWKTEWITSLTISSGTFSPDLVPNITRLVACVKVIPSCGSFLMEGSDFLDALIAAWAQVTPDISRKLVVAGFYCLNSLLEDEPKNASLLLDHIYTLKANHEERMQRKDKSSILEQILGTTPMLDKLQHQFATVQGRGHTLVQEVQAIALRSGLRRRRLSHKPSKKGKGKVSLDDSDDLQIHKMSLVTQVQDLFPALHISRILQLLDVYDDNPEQVVAYLLDNPPSPQPSLQSSPTPKALPTVSEASAKLPPHTSYISQLPTRRNIYDNEEDLATLSMDSSRLYTGHKPDKISLQASSTSAKAAILSALAAFDSDSDERDDTYDVDDVGGTVDASVSGAGDDHTNPHEDTLYAAWKSAPKNFARDAETRRSKSRVELRNKTGMTDESIEGWAIMLSRDPQQQARLANNYPVFDGQQTALQSSSWNAEDEIADSEGEVQRHHTDRGRGGRMRGRGAGRGQINRATQASGEGSTSNPQQNTANDRRRKDANKGSRANHNRRDQRAKKVARAGFPG